MALFARKLFVFLALAIIRVFYCSGDYCDCRVFALPAWWTANSPQGIVAPERVGSRTGNSQDFLIELRC